jgi:hypothetical protein
VQGPPAVPMGLPGAHGAGPGPLQGALTLQRMAPALAGGGQPPRQLCAGSGAGWGR